MNIPAEFDDIRPYTPEELPQIFEELLSDKDFQAVIQSVMPNVPLEMIAAQLRHCKTNLENVFPQAAARHHATAQ